MLSLEEELRRIVALLEAEGVAYAVAGGVAVSIYTRPRATEDLDLVISGADLEATLARLEALGFRRAGPPMAVARGRLRIQRLTKIAGSDLLPLDLLLAESPDLVEVLQGRRRLAWGGSSLWIVSAEGLRTLKKLRGSPQDLADLDALGAEGLE
jgi:hypothetical protein